jgi:RNA polymerase sigma-B factor
MSLVGIHLEKPRPVDRTELLESAPQESAGVGAAKDSGVAEGGKDNVLSKQQQDELVLEYMDVAESVARSFAGSGREVADLRQVACTGLVKAARRYDPHRGVQFPAFAVPTVTGEIKRYLRDNSWPVRPPRQLQDLRSVACRTVPELAQMLGREPSLSELAEELDEPEKLVAEALNCQSSLRPESFEASADGRTLQETVGWEDNRIDRTENVLMLRSALYQLSVKEKELLFRRYFHEETQQQIGDGLGLTQMQVSRMLSRILVKLQRWLLDEAAASPEADVQAQTA